MHWRQRSPGVQLQMRRRSESYKLLVEDLNESELMKELQKNSALDGIKKEQLKPRVFTLEFKPL